MSDKQKVGQQFVQAYYATLVNTKNDLIKFYQPEAMIWRESLGSGKGIKLADYKEDLFVELPRGCEISVTDFTENVFQGGIHITVFGHILDDDKTIVFTQSFVLLECSDRYCVVSDTLKVAKAGSVVNTTAETFVLQKQQKSKGGKNQKFATFIPGKSE